MVRGQRSFVGSGADRGGGPAEARERDGEPPESPGRQDREVASGDAGAARQEPVAERGDEVLERERLRDVLERGRELERRDVDARDERQRERDRERRRLGGVGRADHGRDRVAEARERQRSDGDAQCERSERRRVGGSLSTDRTPDGFRVELWIPA